MAYKGALLEYQHDKHLKWKNFTVSDFVLTLLLWDFLTISNLQLFIFSFFFPRSGCWLVWFGIFWGLSFICLLGWEGMERVISLPPKYINLFIFTVGINYYIWQWVWMFIRLSCFLSLYHCLRPACVIAALSWLFYWIQHRQIVQAIFSYGELYNLYSLKKWLHKFQIQNY